jgi:tetratricopeptide (TPR) repeat protein
MRRKAILCLLLAAATLAVYWPVRDYGFIDFDDPEYVQHNELVNHGLTLQSVRSAFTTPVVANWHPITTLSHILDCQLFGVHAGPQHLVNVALHIANALLLFLVLCRFTTPPLPNSTAPPPAAGPPPAARCFFVAALFALHPLRVESVAWISERKDVLSGFFFLLTLYAYVRYAEARGGGVLEWWSIGKGKSEIQPSITPKLQSPAAPAPQHSSTPALHCAAGARFYALALGFFALGLMSKPMLVTTPVLLLLLDFWPLGRFAVANPKSEPDRTAGSRDLRTTDHGLTAEGLAKAGPRTQPFSIQHSAFSICLEKAPFFGLAALFSLLTIFVQHGSGAVTPLTLITLGDRLDNAIVSYLRYLAKLLWPTRLAVIYPHPAAHYFPMDRWPEWQTPLIALLLLALTALVVWWARRRPYLAFGWFWYLISMLPVIGLIQVGEQAMADRYTYIPLIGPVIALAWLVCDATSSRFTHWPRRSTAEAGHALAAPKRSEGGSLSPHPGSRAAMGTAALAVLAICAILSRRQVGYWRSTTALFEHAVAVTGGNPSAQFSVGVGLEKEGLTNQAIVRYRVAMAIAPRDQQTHFNLAHLLREEGFLSQAIEQYQAVLALNPTDLAGELNLAQTLDRAGQTQQAAAHFQAALRLDPNSVEALNNLAWLLATSGAGEIRDGNRAVQLAERACELTHFKATVVVGTLAAAYAEAGRFTEAVETARKACALAEALGQMGLAQKNRELLELYRQGRAYRESTAPNRRP